MADEKPLAFELISRPPFLVLQLKGQLNRAADAALKDCLAQVKDQDLNCIIVNLDGDAGGVARSGYSLFVEFLKDLRAEKISIRVTGLGERMQDLIDNGVVRAAEAALGLPDAIGSLQKMLDESMGDPILVVDDEKLALDYIGRILREGGFQTVNAESADTAIALMKKRVANLGKVRISCILCDWQLPGDDGIAFLKKVRGSEFSSVPFVLMSGKISKDELEKASENRANGIVLKPVQQGVLIQKIKEVTGRK